MKLVLVLALGVLIVRLLFFYLQPQTIEFENTSGEANIPIVSSLKEKITESALKALPPDAAALLLGIVFGDKGNFDREYFEAIRATGVLHVIAASGMNVSMVAGVIFPSLALFISRKKALIVASAAIFIYAAFAEFEESIVRASIMAVFAYGAALLGRQNTAILSLLFAAFIMLMFELALLVSIGFQLSFAATAGIVLIEPVFKKFENNKSAIMKAFLEDFRTTIAAQIATLPILIFYFGAFSPISPIANLLILWTIPPLMIIGGLGAIATIIVPFISASIFLLAFPLLTYFKEVILFVNNYAVEFNVKNIPILFILGYYCLILASIMALWKHFKIRL